MSRGGWRYAQYHVSNERLVKAINQVWGSLGKQEVYVVPFMETVRRVLKIPRLSVSKSELEKFGYVVDKDILIRRSEGYGKGC